MNEHDTHIYIPPKHGVLFENRWVIVRFDQFCGCSEVYNRRAIYGCFAQKSMSFASDSRGYGWIAIYEEEGKIYIYI